jgi:hypothetical protein
MKLPLLKNLRLAVAVVGIALGGCAIAPPAALTPEGTKLPINKQLVQQLRTPPVDPEKQTSGASTVEVLLAVTLETTLANFDYLQPIKTKPAYTVEGKVEKVELPVFGMTFTIPLLVRYSIRGQGDAVVHEKVIESTGVATPSDAFVGARRLGIAAQRAVQNNIDLFMKELTTLNLPPAKP